jgi:8-oxo-dGTP diphosphatase
MINVTCAIIFVNDKILVTQRSENMKLSLKWEFPGGKVEKKENEIECIIREIKEEINIEIDVFRRLSNSVYDYGTFKINLIPFLANYISGDIVLAEHKDFKLLDKSELLNLDWAEADLPIVEEFLKLEL